VVFERLTDSSRDVLVGAERAARQCGHGRVEAPHVLVAILRKRDTKGGQALDEAGLRYVDVLVAVAQLYPPAEGRPQRPLALTAGTECLLDLALSEADGAGARFVETAHLALACSRPDAPAPVRALVAGHEQAIRAAAEAALQQSAQLEIALRERRSTARTAPRELTNIARTRRAQLKRDLKYGRASFRTVVLDPPDFAETAKVFDLLLAVPNYRRAKVQRLMTKCRISPSKTIGGLSQRQRDALLGALR